MDEPLLCWMFLFLAIIWGSCTFSREKQKRLEGVFGRLTFCVQWYNVTFVLLFALFLRTLWDVLKFEYIHDRMLSWDSYSQNLDESVTYIPLSHGKFSEADIDHGSLVIPSFLRWLSLASPLAGLTAFGISCYQVVARIMNQMEKGNPGESFLHMVVLGMPLLYIVMAMRATIRQWAVMTGSCWLPFYHDHLQAGDLEDWSYDDRKELWRNVKAAELSTYTQDLEVASGFQFFAVFCFGQVCSRALRRIVNNDGNNEESHEVGKDAGILLQLGILGLHAFVILGVVRTVINILCAVASTKTEWADAVESIQQGMMGTFDPVFGFATVLSVINMLLLGKMDKVAETLPNINTKFNATRALLLIGQIQLTVLKAATTSTSGALHKSKILDAIHKLGLKNVTWWFNMNQCRLLHSSLLCFECLIVVIINSVAWAEDTKNLPKPYNSAEARERPERDELAEPLLLQC